jgi:hypothetical protein
MALITKNPNRKSSGAYERLTGNKAIAELITSIQAATISTGNQVDIKLRLSYEGDLPIFYGKDVNTAKKTLDKIKEHPNGVIIFGGYISYYNNVGKQKKQEVDVILFVNGKVYCYEIKDGNSLDTKKSKSEIDVIESFYRFFSEKNFDVEVGLISINMKNGKHQFKDDRINDYLISGFDFSNKFNFNFKKYLSLQEREQPLNEEFTIEQMRLIINEYDSRNNINKTFI